MSLFVPYNLRLRSGPRPIFETWTKRSEGERSEDSVEGSLERKSSNLDSEVYRDVITLEKKWKRIKF